MKVEIEYYGYGKGRIELKLDQDVQETHSIELKGFGRRVYQIATVDLEEGRHYIQANLYFEDCVSSKADWFWVTESERIEDSNSDTLEESNGDLKESSKDEVFLDDEVVDEMPSERDDESSGAGPLMAFAIIFVNAVAGIAGRIIR